MTSNPLNERWHTSGRDLSRPHILFVTEKWCDGHPSCGLSNSEYNLFQSIASTGLASHECFHFDEYWHQHGSAGDSALLALCQARRPDILIYTHLGIPPEDRYNPNPKTLQTLRRELGIPIVAIWWDSVSTAVQASIRRLAPFVDRHVAIDAAWPLQQLEAEKAINSGHLKLWTPQDPSMFYDARFERNLDIAFLGSIQDYPDRLQALKALREAGLSVTQGGGQREGHLSPEDYAAVYRRSKIVVNCARTRNGGFTRQLKGCVFEATLSGALLLDEDNLETRRFFTPGVEYASFSGLDDLVAKARYFLSEDNARRHVAEAGHRRALNEYSALRFWSTILESVISKRVSATAPAVPAPLANLFSSGDYPSVVLHSQSNDWRPAAALALMGHTRRAIAELGRFKDDEARFHLAVAHWMDGNEAAAKPILTELKQHEHAKNLLSLINKPTIRVLAQTEWFENDFQDPKFSIQMAGLSKTKTSENGTLVVNVDTPKEAFEDILKSIAGQPAPDFYFSSMIEWHLLPKNLQALPFPTFGVTSDFDLHIQNIHPWLAHFDELITVGSEEWEKVRRLSGRPVSVFPKMFGLPEGLPELKPVERPVDLHISGTIANAFHPDKALLLQQLLQHDAGRIHYVDGFVHHNYYYDQLAEAKASFTYVRHGTSMPSRGLEALAMGCAVVTQKGSPLTLWAGEEEGVLTYDAQAGELPHVLRKLKENWAEIAPRARRGAEIIRREFVMPKCISQFLRYLTVLAAKPRPARQPAPRENLHQKRGVFQRGHCFASPTNIFMLKHNAERWGDENKRTSTPQHAINYGRELGLFVAGDLVAAHRNVHSLQMDAAKKQAVRNEILEHREKLLRRVELVYSEAIQKHPRSLVLLFNALRHGLHLGNPKDVSTLLKAAADAVRQPLDHWEVDPMDDVFPWDYFSSFFNYRSYIDTVTNGLVAGNVDRNKLARLILASIHYYLGHYSGDTGQFRKAVELDPEFPNYRYYLAESLQQSGQDSALNEAVALFTELAQTSILLEPAFLALTELNVRHGMAVPRLPEIEATVRKLRNISESSNGSSDDFLAVNLVLPPGISKLPTQQSSTDTAPIPQHSPLASHLASKNKDSKRESILVIPFECANWQNARAWSYNGYFAFEEGFRAARADVLTLPAIAGVPSNHPASWLKYAKDLCAGRSFDQVWIWVTHNHYSPELLEWLKQVAPVRVGVVMESMEHTPAEYAMYPTLPGRRERVSEQLRHMTHVLTFDDHDAVTFAKDLPIRSLWCPPVVPWRSVGAQVDFPTAGPAVFHGTIYSPERKAFLEHTALAGKLIKPPLPEEQTLLPQLFDALQVNSFNTLNTQRDANLPLLTNYMASLRRLRRQLFDLWLDGLRAGYASVNLPSIFKCYAGRVVESMAAGRPVISWDVPRERTKALFTPGKEILLFDKDKPEELAAQIDRLQKDPAYAHQIAENARQKVLRYHTAEIRVRQILDWIKDGTEPDYGENTIPTEYPMKTQTETIETQNSKSHPLARFERCQTEADIPGAILALQEHLQTNPQDAQAVEALGSLQFTSGDAVAALESFDKLAGLRPNDAMTHTRRAMAAYNATEYELFEAALQQALEIDPRHTATLQFFAKVCLDQNRYVDAGRVYLELLKQAPENVDYLLVLGFCLHKGGEIEVARTIYERVLEIEPSNTVAKENLNFVPGTNSVPKPLNGHHLDVKPEPVKPDIDALFLLAQKNIEQGDLSAAQTQLATLLEIIPNDPAALSLFTTTLYRQGDFQAAREHARSLTRQTPQVPSSWIQLSATCLKLDDIPEFEMALEKALELNPENPDAILLLAHATFQAENYLEAARLYSRVIFAQPNSVEAAMAFGVCCAKTGLKEEAVEMFARVLELDPSNAIARENIQSLQPKPSAAKPTPTIAEKPTALHTVENGNQNTPAVVLVGSIKESEALLKEGRFLDAWNAGLHAISERPFHPDAYLHLAEIALEAGDDKQARECIRRLRQLTPNWDIPQRVEHTLKKQKLLRKSQITWPALPELSNQPTLTVCMIVKNEEAVLARCLKSVQSIAKQIIVVDTGSTDRTVEIAKQHGAEVHSFVWNNNFSDARNHGLQFAREDWVLILDADEELPSGSNAALRHDMAQPNQLGFRIPLKNFNETADGIAFVPRLFRNAPGLHFVFRVHEQIFSSIVARKPHWKMEAGLGTAMLMHYGYDPEVKKLKNKVQRNLDLLELAIIENPDEVGLLMNYGLDLVNSGRSEEAFVPFRKAVRLLSEQESRFVLPEVRERLMTMVTFHLLQAEEYEELIQLVGSKLSHDTGPTASLHYAAALALIRTQRKSEAIPHLRACLEKRALPVLTPEASGVNGSAPHHLLADCLANTGAVVEAEEQFKLALASGSRTAGVLHNYAKFLTSTNRATEAIQILFNAIHEGTADSDLWSLGCVITNGHLKDSEVALDWTESAVQSHPDHREIRKQRGIALLTVGRFSEALEHLQHLSGAADASIIAAIILCQIATGIKPSAVTGDNEINVTKQFVFWLRRLLEFRQEESAKKVMKNASLLEYALPSAAKVLKEAAIDS